MFFRYDGIWPSKWSEFLILNISKRSSEAKLLAMEWFESMHVPFSQLLHWTLYKLESERCINYSKNNFLKKSVIPLTQHNLIFKEATFSLTLAKRNKNLIIQKCINMLHKQKILAAYYLISFLMEKQRKAGTVFSSFPTSCVNCPSNLLSNSKESWK